MTPERRKSILILIGTLIIGMLLGLLVPSLLHKIKGRSGQSDYHGGNNKGDQKSEWFSETVTRVVKPDSSQSLKVNSITRKAAAQIDSIETHANLQMSSLLDSVKVQLKPILTENQWRKLQEFDAKAKSNWHKHGRGKRGH
jgi:hypothetical protein